MFNERIMFLGSTFCQWLEPVSIVSDSHFDGPTLHAVRYFVGDATVEGSSIVDNIDELCVYLARQVLEHLFAVEYILGEIFAGTFSRSSNFNGFLVEGLFYDSES